MNKDFRAKHLKQSPTTPFTIVETQGGIFLHWGGDTFDQCAELYGAEFERVFYKNLVAAGVRIWSIYMVRILIQTLCKVRRLIAKSATIDCWWNQLGKPRLPLGLYLV